jgi:hypothetical protein
VVKKYFRSIEDLAQIDGWSEIAPLDQSRLRSMLDVQSHVFSIYVTARRPTGVDGEPSLHADRRTIEREEEEGKGLVRTVRSVVWRRVLEDGSVQIVPLVRWEVLDYVPLEVQDFPDEDR